MLSGLCGGGRGEAGEEEEEAAALGFFTCILGRLRWTLKARCPGLIGNWNGTIGPLQNYYPSPQVEYGPKGRTPAADSNDFWKTWYLLIQILKESEAKWGFSRLGLHEAAPCCLDKFQCVILRLVSKFSLVTQDNEVLKATYGI